MRLSTIRQFTSITTGTTTERLKIISARTDSVRRGGRDQDHVMFGLGNLAEACETAYNQGDEKMYAALDNRLLTGYEYTAKYNLGESVPFTTWTDISGRYCNFGK